MTTGPKRHNAPQVARRRKPPAADANEKIALLKRERDEALEREAATAEVLKVISRSTFDLQAVLETLVQSAGKLCQAENVQIFLRDGEFYRLAADNGFSPEYQQYVREHPIRPGRGTLVARTALGVVPVQIPDRLADPEYTYHEGGNLGGYRTMLGVPLVRDGNCIGVIALTRSKVRPFTDKQIELVQNFAAQAVIAIENTRLLNELRQRTDDLSESLQQQTATSEILDVISKSPTDSQPVFDAIVRSGLRLFPNAVVVISLPDGDMVKAAAIDGADQADLESLRARYPMPLSREYITGTAILDRREMDFADARETPAQLIPGGKNFLASGYRAITVMPMMRGETAIGGISVVRRQPGALSDKQRELLRTFASQAVIAIENTRLFNELRQRTDDLSEALEQQTATSEVLKVISSSPGDLDPVFQAMLANAVRICDAKFGVMLSYNNEMFNPAAMFDMPPALVEFFQQRGSFQPNSGTNLERMWRTKDVIRVADEMAEPVVSPPAKHGGARSLIAVPMLKENELIGAIVIYRQEVRPFTDKQVELVQNFAAQAVIAIENTRLLNELRQRTTDLSESLEQQTATSEVLQVVSASPGDLTPVFDAMLENAMRICHAKFGGLFRVEDGMVRRAATVGVPAPLAQALRNLRPMPINPLCRVITTGETIHLDDYRLDQAYLEREPVAVAGVELGGIRTLLLVPMIKGNERIGIIAIFRQHVEPFSEKQIELLQNFAAQAVIAIENTRLLNELRQSTADLTQSLEDLRTAQDRLVQTEKLASLGQLTAGIAHEIKNPLNFINNFSAVSVELIDELRQALAGANLDNRLRAQISEIADTLQGNLDKVVQHGKRADAIVKNMLLHSRQSSGEHRPIDINDIVEESLNLAYHGARAEKQGFNITLERSFDPAAGEVDLFPQEITRVLLNLISNGFYAATKRKAHADNDTYEPTLSASTRSLGDSVEIRIRDNGTGIPPEVKAKMFNPFFTTKPVGEGTGLGLSISHDIIVKQHGGSIEVDTQPGEFTEFRIVLPRAAASIAKSGERP